MARVLITRLSSFGDVAMLVPVVFSVASRYPQDRFVVLTRKAFAPLFENLGFNISAATFDPHKHDGPLGLLKLMNRISSSGYSHIADVHDVLRTKVLRTSMLVRGKKVATIDKGREEKASMIASKKLTPPLRSTTDRYMEVFEKLGFPAEMIFDNFFELRERSLYPLRSIVTEKLGSWIGIAPFSKYKEKIYPLDKMEQVVADLASRNNTTIFLFGSGPSERSVIEAWDKKYSNVISVAGKINLENELLLMSYIDVMITMDSANMHLASLVKTPVVSIWGATHPSLGFRGFGQDVENMIGVDNLSCRPCSVFGSEPCTRGDYACLTNIKESTIINKVIAILEKESETQNADPNIGLYVVVEERQQIELVYDEEPLLHEASVTLLEKQEEALSHDVESISEDVNLDEEESDVLSESEEESLSEELSESISDDPNLGEEGSETLSESEEESLSEDQTESITEDVDLDEKEEDTLSESEEESLSEDQSESISDDANLGEEGSETLSESEEESLSEELSELISEDVDLDEEEEETLSESEEESLLEDQSESISDDVNLGEEKKDESLEKKTEDKDKEDKL